MFPVIPAPAPSVVPAVAEKVFDRFFVKSILIDTDASNPNGLIAAISKLQIARIDENGNWEIGPDSTPRVVQVPDLIGRATAEATAGDLTLAGIVSSLMTYVARLVTEQLTPQAPPPDPPPDTGG